MKVLVTHKPTGEKKVVDEENLKCDDRAEVLKNLRSFPNIWNTENYFYERF